MHVVPIASNPNEALIAEAIDDLLNSRKTKVQYKYWDQLDWMEPTVKTQLFTFMNFNVAWRRKPEPVTKYCNVYSGNRVGSSWSTRDAATKKDNSGERIGVLVVTFEHEKDPTFEFVKA